MISLIALLAFAVLIGGKVLPELASSQTSAEKNAGTTSSAGSPSASRLKSASGASPRGEVVIAGYSGIPYTYPSDVRISNPGETDLTLRDAQWEGRPFKSPIYYGARVQQWSRNSNLGAMIDFTHSKAISNPEQKIRMDGRLYGKDVPREALVRDMFKHLEFSHGHNMLTLNGLYRLKLLTSSLSPYVGIGAGVALPHTEIGYRQDDKKGRKGKRTYEYQYAGPVLQALAGLEIRLPKLSLFVEYKFSFSPYEVPLTNRRHGGWLYEDLWRQFSRWWSGTAPPGGFLSTRLVSHQLIGGIGVRIVPDPVMAAGPR